jgi:hypothetical protein
MSDVPPCFICGKTHEQVRRLIVSSGYFGLSEVPPRAICSECIILNMEILASESTTYRDELVALLQALEPQNSN